MDELPWVELARKFPQESWGLSLALLLSQRLAYRTDANPKAWSNIMPS